MIKRFRSGLAIAGLCLGLGMWAQTQTSSPTPAATQKEAPTGTHARGTFEVKMARQADPGADPSLGRFTSEKLYHGDLEGTGKGQMLTAGDVSKGSAGYVAIELVSGTLAGRKGTFILQHSGTMDHGAQHLSVTVVPESGSGELEGLSGKMNIIIEGGKHSYDFEYAVAKSK